jgi:hypothetical protein
MSNTQILQLFTNKFNQKLFTKDINQFVRSREYLRGKYHCTIDLLFDWFGLTCFANKNKNCHLSYSCFETSQTGVQWYSDSSPFSIPWLDPIIYENERRDHYKMHCIVIITILPFSSCFMQKQAFSNHLPQLN